MLSVTTMIPTRVAPKNRSSHSAWFGLAMATRSPGRNPMASKARATAMERSSRVRYVTGTVSPLSSTAWTKTLSGARPAASRRLLAYVVMMSSLVQEDVALQGLVRAAVGRQVGNALLAEHLVINEEVAGAFA